VAGVALARLIRSRAVGTVLGVVGSLFFFFTYWLWFTSPFGLFGVQRSALMIEELGTELSATEADAWTAVYPPDRFMPEYLGIDRHLGFYGLHLAYVVGLVLTLAGIALLRSGRDRRSLRLLGAGVLVAVVAAGTEILVHDGVLDWMGTM
jgi:hypothetical protein